MAKNIAVIGDSESIKGFAAIGMDIYPCDDNENAPHLFRRLLTVTTMRNFYYRGNVRTC